jgi:hypothetical protein
VSTTFEKTWQQLGNQALDQSSTTNNAKNEFWFFKAFLMGQLSGQSGWSGKWSMYCSCDGTTAGTAGDGVDRWTSSFDPTKLVNASPGTNHSWAVLTRTINSVAWYVYLDYANGSPYIGTFGMSKAAPTGGTSTDRPTSTDEVFNSNWTNIQFCRFTNTSMMSALLSTTGDFAFMGQEPGNSLNTPYLGWFFQIPMETKAADTWPAVMWMAQGTNPWQQSAFQNHTLWSSRKFDGSAIISLTPLRGAVASSDPYFATTMGGVPDGADSLWDDLPIYIVCPTSGSQTLKGRLADFKWAPQALPNGYIEPDPSAPTSMVIGNTWTPFAFVADF